MIQDQPFIWKTSLSGTISWVGQSLWGSPGWAHSVSQVDGVSGMAPAYQLCGSVALWEKVQKRAMASARLDVRHFSFSLYATGAFQASTLVLELRGSESM